MILAAKNLPHIHTSGVSFLDAHSLLNTAQFSEDHEQPTQAQVSFN